MRSKGLFKQRYRQINDFERYLVENGFLVLKFFLNLSYEKQKKRFLERMDQKEKYWKFSPSDLEDRAHWDEFKQVYEEVMTETSTEYAPWRVIPADNRWISSLAVTQTLLKTLESLGMEYPEPDAEIRETMEKARADLESGD